MALAPCWADGVIRGCVVGRGQCSSKSRYAGSELSDPRVRIAQGKVRQRAPYPGRCAATNTSLILTEITIDLSCRIGAERPNVIDEPRRELARRVQHDDSLSVVSFQSSFGRTRRDRSRRWLWRLVGRFFRFPHTVQIAPLKSGAGLAFIFVGAILSWKTCGTINPNCWERPLIQESRPLSAIDPNG